MFYRPAEGHGLPHDPFKALVAPRPIGWLSTVDAAGRRNLAPYSFFNGCGDNPPMVMVARTGRKSRAEAEKDSFANIRATGEFACNIVGRALAEAMNLSSGVYPPDADEFEISGLTPAPGIAIAAPHVAEAPAVLECRLVKLIDDLPSWQPHMSNLVAIGEVVGVHIAEAALSDGRVEVLSYNPVARMGYMEYTTVTAKWDMARPG